MRIGLKDIPKKYKKNPILKGIPDDLKTEEKFREITTKCSEIMKAEHQHKSVKSFVTCVWCQENLKKRQEYIKELGFKSYGQYAEYSRVMSIIINKTPIQVA